jgi:hypothetical protein
MENYDKLKSIIQAANPEIMELKFGCEYIDHKGDTMLYVRTSPNHHYGILKRTMSNTLFSCVRSDVKILGRPIRLADVLLAIDKRYDGNHFATAASNGWLHFEGIRGFWNLKDDNLDHQSDETKQFLIDLLIPSL